MYLVVVLTPINVFSSIGGGAMSASRVVAKGMYSVGCMFVDIKVECLYKQGLFNELLTCSGCESC